MIPWSHHHFVDKFRYYKRNVPLVHNNNNCNENYVGETGQRLWKELLTIMVRIKTHTHLNIPLRGNMNYAFKSLVSWEAIIIRTNFAKK